MFNFKGVKCSSGMFSKKILFPCCKYSFQRDLNMREKYHVDTRQDIIEKNSQKATREII
jgi:hypothetical protein